jgi:hypothetical protein
VHWQPVGARNSAEPWSDVCRVRMGPAEDDMYMRSTLVSWSRLTWN